MSVDLMHEMATRQVVLLGETHTIAEIHRWQLHVATILRFIRRNVAVGFEMFPRRVQPVLDEWVAGELSSQHSSKKSIGRTIWGYDAQLYLPLFHFCRQQRVPMLALNCNRPLVTRVGKDGWDAIPEDERDGLSPAAEATARLSRISVRAGPQSLADRAGIGDGSIARSIYPRAADVGSRLCLQHCAGDRSQPDPPLVIGIIGRGHLEYGHGTPFQLRDLGIPAPAVLLPATRLQHDATRINGIADAIFRCSAEPPNRCQHSMLNR